MHVVLTGNFRAEEGHHETYKNTEWAYKEYDIRYVVCAPGNTTFIATNTKAAEAISRATNLKKREQRRRASAYRHRESEPLTDPWPRQLSIDISRMEQQSRVMLYVDICHSCMRVSFYCVCVYMCVPLYTYMSLYNSIRTIVSNIIETV